METQEYINIICSTLSKEEIERIINKLSTRIMGLCGENNTDAMKKVSDTIDVLKTAINEYGSYNFTNKVYNSLKAYVEKGYGINLSATEPLNYSTEKEWMEKAYDLMILGRDWHYERLIEIQKDINIIEKNPDIKFNSAPLLLAIKKEEINDKIKEATETIEHIKKTYLLT